MSLYEIVNPSDPVTFEAPDDLTARFAVLLLSGAYGLVNEKGESVGTMWLFGATKEALAKDGTDIKAFRANPEAMKRVADALDSTAVCSMSNRKALLAATNGDPTSIERWNEEKRSSLNNICARARATAKHLRALAAPMEPAR